MATTSISQLDSATSVSNNDLFETAVPDSGSASGYASKKHSMAVIANHVASDVNYPALLTTAKTLVAALNEVGGKMLTGTLVAGNTSLVLSDAAITTSSMIDIYTDTYGMNPSAVTVVTGSITLTFDAQAADVAVKVRVM